MTEPREATGVRLDPDVNEARKSADESFSNNVNAWARHYYLHGMNPLPAAALDDLIEETRRDIEILDDLRERAERRVERLKGLKAPAPAGDTSTSAYNMEDARAACAGIPDHYRTPENEAIQLWAPRVGLSPEELLDELDSGPYSRTRATKVIQQEESTAE